MEVTHHQRPVNIDTLPQHSDNVDEELRRVNLALRTVFSPYAFVAVNNQPQQTPEWWTQRQLADRYLTSFQSKPISWMVCDQLLQPQNQRYDNTDSHIQQQRLFFAAQTLHTKCCIDIHELPIESLPSLRDSLLDHLKRYSGGVTGNNNINDALTNRLGMCVSVLAVQMGWITIISDLLSTPKEDNIKQNAISMSILRSLPEECASDKLFLIDENTRYQMRDHLVSTASTVFSYLHSFISNNDTSLKSQSITEATEIVYKIFFIWIRFVPIQPLALVQTPLLQSVIHGLTQIEYLDVAADVIVEILHMYPSHHFHNEQLVKLIIPALSQLPWDDVLRSGNEDILRVYCRVATEMGESYMSLILSADYQQASTLVEGVLRCTEISNTEISAITFHFWYRMVLDLEECEPYEWRQELVDFYTPHLLKLISICACSLMKYPTDIDSFDDDRIDDLNNHRTYVAETIEDCCRLVGGHLVLNQIGTFLRDEVQRASVNQPFKWHGLESAFACLAALRKYVPKDENDVLPLCFEIISQLPSESPLLRYMACKVIGNFAFWLAANPTLLQPLLLHVSHGLQIPGCASAAAVAIKELCENISIAEPVLLLYEQFTSPTHSNRLDLNDELQILEGLCRALSRMIQETRGDGREYLNRLAHPICNRFASCVVDPNASFKVIVPEIDRLATLARFLLIPAVPSTSHPLLELMQSVWNLFDTVTNRFPNEIIVAEKICRFHKYALRSCGPSVYAPVLQVLVEQLVRSFAITRRSPYLYLASICVSEYGKDVTLYQPMYKMMDDLSQITFSFLRSFDELTSHPDVVEEYFYLMGRMMDHYAEQFVMSELLPSICQCAVVAMQLDHQGAHKGSLKFLDCLVSNGLKLKDSNKSESLTALLHLFSQVGQPLVVNFIRILSGDLPSYNDQAQDIMWKIHRIYPSLLIQWLQSSFERNLPVPERAKSEFVAAVDMGLEKDEFDLVVNAFRSACEREHRIRRINRIQNRRN